MKNTMLVLIAGTLLFTTVLPAAGDLNVVATLPEIGALVETIGGERVKVTTLARGDEDPHVLPAKPSHSRRMLKADLLVYNGLQLEVGWLPLLIRGARNPEIRSGGAGNLDLSDVIAPLEVPEGGADRSAGDVHPEGNPHYTVDPAVYPQLAEKVADHLSKLDPDGSDYYRKRLDAFTGDWDRALEGWKGRAAFLAGLEVISYHQQWEYLADTFGFRIVDRIEDRPGIPPTARHLADLEKEIRAKGIAMIVFSDLVPPELPEKIAARAQCRAVALPQSMGSRKGTEDLYAWFETLIQALEQAYHAEAR